jgi:ATP-binding cassette subfamily B protein
MAHNLAAEQDSAGATSRFTVARFLRPYFGRLTLVLAILGFNAFLGLLNPWLVQQLFDRVLLARRLDLLWWFGAVFVSVAVVRFAIEYVQAQTYTRVSTRVLLDMQRDFLAHLARLSLRFFAGARFGDLMTRFNRDLGQIQQFATGLLPSLVTSLFTLVGALAWGLWYGADLFLIACAPLPIALIVARLFRKRVEMQTRRLRELSADVANSVTETLTGIRTVRSFGRERGEIARFVRRSHQFLRASLGFQRTNSLASGLPRMCLVASSVIIYSLGGARVIRGEMQLGALLALSMYVAMAFGPLLSLADFYLQLVQTRVSLERVRELRDMPLDTPEDPATPRPLPVVGAIRFDDVHFRHSEREPLLEGVSFSVAPGETVALVGPSGAGKSTVIDLLFRFVDPQRGKVEIDSQDLRSVQVARIRREMAVVSQDVFLFHDSVFENIRYGARNATREDVLAAARAAGVDRMLAERDQGLDTIVGERGTQLSGGQRQRIAVARALLRKPKILVLDEATSSLDYASDRAIRDALAELSRRATTLIVTHRLTQVLDVDRVLVLDGGRIVEQGPPHELAARGRLRDMLAAAQPRSGSSD